MLDRRLIFHLDWALLGGLVAARAMVLIVQNRVIGFEELFRDHEILGRVGKHLEAVLGEEARRLDQAENVGLQGVGIADHSTSQLVFRPIGQ